jgi:hypothetical protein
MNFCSIVQTVSRHQEMPIIGLFIPLVAAIHHCNYEGECMDLRPLNEEEKNALYMLNVLYAQVMAEEVMQADTPVEKLIGNAQAVAKVEGLLDRIIRTGQISPVLSTLERASVGDGN